VVDTQPLLDALTDAGVRSTEPRRAVAELIAGREGHFTARDIVDDAAAQHLGIGRATVFRALDLFVDLGAVERLDLPDGEHAYVACRPTHHHHIVCSTCGRSVEFDDTGLAERIARDVEARTGYRVDQHRLELFGTCPDCHAAAAAAR
jgi:Fur family ferric uptake transcriptional regulator